MQDIRNIAIIAHVDHGKTTLVDKMMLAGNLFRDGKDLSGQVLDNNDLERERGITILSKNVSINWKGTKINIIDTPGHSDFGGEVERVLNMADGCLLLVDAFEGPMPQTRFVLSKALSLGLKIIICINKIDRPDARIHEVVEEVLGLLIDLDATDEQLDSPIVYCSGRKGTSTLTEGAEGENLIPLFETILSHIPCPEGDDQKPAKLLISAIDYNNYVGRIGIGRVEQGVIRTNSDVVVSDWHNRIQPYKSKIANLYQIEGLKRVPCDAAAVGDIVCVSGIENINIGNTVSSPENSEPCEFVKITDPTVQMTFSVNDSPFAGKEGKFVTSQRLRERLYSELLKDVSLRVEDTDSTDSFKVSGRGEMHLSILIETMRREGYERLYLGQLLRAVAEEQREAVGLLAFRLEEEAVGLHVFERSEHEVVGREAYVSRLLYVLDMQRVEPKRVLSHGVAERGAYGVVRESHLLALLRESVVAVLVLQGVDTVVALGNATYDELSARVGACYLQPRDKACCSS